MSKLSFRARALDASKPMPIYMAEELPDLPDYSAISRAVPIMPTGMEKEEECEHHLQRAIITGLIIPTPEVANMTDAEAYDKIYPNDAKLPRQLIHMQPFAMEQDIPDYDMDSEDERWVSLQAKKMDIDELKFEEMMDRLEKGSGQTVVTLQEAKSLLKEDDDLIIAVYDYWLNKRLKTQHPLILTVKTEHRLGSAANNPYLAFRRRTEKMQTRKNRKNDETSYEKMLKLRRDLSRAVTLLELAKRREKTKRELVHLTIEVFEKRYQCADFNGNMLAEVSAIKVPRPAFAPLFTNQFGINHQNWSKTKEDGAVRKEKRQYKKRKHKGTSASQRAASAAAASYVHASAAGSHDMLSSDDEMDAAAAAAAAAAQSEEDAEPDPAEDPFAFRRRMDCSYLAPKPLTSLGNWPWCSRDEGGQADPRYRYCRTSISRPRRRFVGLARRRVGRGGRILLDRADQSDEDLYGSMDFTVRDKWAVGSVVGSVVADVRDAKDDWLHFRPRTPTPTLSSSDSDAEPPRSDPLRSAFAPDATLAVEPSDSDDVDGAFAATEFYAYEYLSSLPTLDYQLGGDYLEQNPLLERLGAVVVKSEPGTSLDSDEPHDVPGEPAGRRGDSTRGKVGYSEFGCSSFAVRASRPQRHVLTVEPATSAGLDPCGPVASRIGSPHRQQQCSGSYSGGSSSRVSVSVSNQLATTNYLASPAVVTNCADHGYSNGLMKREPGVASCNATAAAAASTGDRVAASGLTNGPGPALPEYPGTSRSRVSVSSNCFPPSSSPPPPQPLRSSPGQLRTSSGVGGGNYVLARGVTINHEPDNEPIVVKSEPMDVDSPEKASNQVCVDKKQLVRKNNSLPMEVT